MWSLAAREFARDPLSNGSDGRYAEVLGILAQAFGSETAGLVFSNKANERRLRLSAVHRGCLPGTTRPGRWAEEGARA